MTIKKILLSSEEVPDSGQQILQGSGNFTVPNGVSNISVLLIEGGAAGNAGGTFVNGVGGTGGIGGLGGRRRYINSVAVTPGQVIAYSVAARAASFGSILTGTTGGVDAGKAGDGTQGNSAISTQTAYGTGGSNGGPTSMFDAEVGYDFYSLTAQGAPGRDGPFPGGGGGGGASGVNLVGSTNGVVGGASGAGVIVVIWPGSARVFPRTRTVPEITNVATFDPRSLFSYLGKIATDGLGTWIGIDVSNVAGSRGRIWRSTDNGRSFTLVGIPRDEQLADITYVSGTWVIATAALNASFRYQFQKSTDAGLTWTYYISTTGASFPVVGLSSRVGRLFVLNTGLTSGEGLATSQDLGVTLTTRAMATTTTRAAAIKQSRFIHLSDTVLLARQGITTSSTFVSFLSRDNGVTWAASIYFDAAKLGTITLAFTNSATSANLYTSTDDLTSVTQVSGFTFTSSIYQRALVPLQDRILIIDGPLTFEYKSGVVSASSIRLPIDIPVNTLTPASNAGVRVATDGIDSIVSFVQDTGSANFRASVYVS